MALSVDISVNYLPGRYWKSGSTISEEEDYLSSVLSVIEEYQSSIVVLPPLEAFPLVQEEAQNDKTSQDLKIQKALTYLSEVIVMSQSFLQNVKERLDNITSIGASVIENLTKLKECLSKFTGCLDEILLFYSDMNSVVNLTPSLEHVKKSTEELKSVLEKMNAEELPHLLPKVKVTQEEIVCAVVGLKNSVAQRLTNLDSDVRSHQTDSYHLLRFISDSYQSAKLDLNNEQPVASKLQEMGFTESRSQKLAEWISKQSLPEHRTLLSWVERYVENIFDYDIFLNGSVELFPYSNKNNEWFDVSVEVYPSGSPPVLVPFFNTTSSTEALNACKARVKEFGLKCWFHGTDHKAADNIVKNGIVFGTGAKSLDFSHGDGFYLNPDYQKTVEWISGVKAGAIIIFKALVKSEFKCLNLESDTEQWRKVVKWNRSGEDREESLDEDLEEQFEECDYIQGPVTIDGAKYTGTNWEPQPSDTPQICVKSKRMASAIGDPDNILGVVCWNSF